MLCILHQVAFAAKLQSICLTAATHTIRAIQHVKTKVLAYCAANALPLHFGDGGRTFRFFFGFCGHRYQQESHADADRHICDVEEWPMVIEPMEVNEIDHVTKPQPIVKISERSAQHKSEPEIHARVLEVQSQEINKNNSQRNNRKNRKSPGQVRTCHRGS